MQKLYHLASQGWKSESERDSWELEFQWLAGSHFFHCTRFQEYEIIINKISSLHCVSCPMFPANSDQSILSRDEVNVSICDLDDVLLWQLFAKIIKVDYLHAEDAVLGKYYLLSKTYLKQRNEWF